MNLDGRQIQFLHDVGSLILPASWIVFPFSHSVERLELAMAEPHPEVLNFASTIVPFSTLICNFMTSPHSGRADDTRAHSSLVLLKTSHVAWVVRNG